MLKTWNLLVIKSTFREYHILIFESLSNHIKAGHAHIINIFLYKQVFCFFSNLNKALMIILKCWKIFINTNYYFYGGFHGNGR